MGKGLFLLLLFAHGVQAAEEQCAAPSDQTSTERLKKIEKSIRIFTEECSPQPPMGVHLKDILDGMPRIEILLKARDGSDALSDAYDALGKKVLELGDKMSTECTKYGPKVEKALADTASSAASLFVNEEPDADSSAGEAFGALMTRVWEKIRLPMSDANAPTPTREPKALFTEDGSDKEALEAFDNVENKTSAKPKPATKTPYALLHEWESYLPSCIRELRTPKSKAGSHR